MSEIESPGATVEVRLKMPKREEGELFGVAVQLHGSDQIRVACEDGVERMCRIPGKLKKRVWIRERDILIIKKWDFQPSKADIVWRFYGMQVERLRQMGVLKNLPL